MDQGKLTFYWQEYYIHCSLKRAGALQNLNGILGNLISPCFDVKAVSRFLCRRSRLSNSRDLRQVWIILVRPPTPRRTHPFSEWESRTVTAFKFL